MSRFEMQIVDLKGVKERNAIQVLRLEKLYMREYGPTFFATVRYAREGVEQRKRLGTAKFFKMPGACAAIPTGCSTFLPDISPVQHPDTGTLSRGILRCNLPKRG